MSDRIGGNVPPRWSRRALRSRRGDENGFALIELLLVCIIMPIVVGGISLALVSVFTLQSGVTSRVTDSADAQTVSANFEQDVQSAVNITTSSSATKCGPGTPLLGLEWNLNQQTGAYQTVVSYVEVASGSVSSLVRQYCSSGASATATSSSTIAFDVPTSQAAPTIDQASTITTYTISTLAAAGWTSTLGITGVTLKITEPGSKFQYTLVAQPASGASSNQLSTVSTPTTSCGFATPGTGTYVSTLCFVDFSHLDVVHDATSPKCQQFTAAITNTPYSLSFCLSLSGDLSVYADTTPTWSSPGGSAFLGNNGFYTGIPNDPALYQSLSGTTTVTITNIQVLDSNGNSATGWEFVSGDAESTDANESITWSSPTTLSLLPDSPTSAYGNACAAPTPSNPGATDLIYSPPSPNAKSIECAETVPGDKTGTVMVQALQPSSMSVVMVGDGLEAIFVGLLLP